MKLEYLKAILKRAYEFKKDQFDDSVEVFKELLDKLDKK